MSCVGLCGVIRIIKKIVEKMVEELSSSKKNGKLIGARKLSFWRRYFIFIYRNDSSNGCSRKL